MPLGLRAVAVGDSKLDVIVELGPPRRPMGGGTKVFGLDDG